MGFWTDYYIKTGDYTTVKNLINDTIVEFYRSDAIGTNGLADGTVCFSIIC